MQPPLSRDGKEVTESSKYSFEVDGASKTIVIKGAALEDIRFGLAEAG